MINGTLTQLLRRKNWHFHFSHSQPTHHQILIYFMLKLYLGLNDFTHTPTCCLKHHLLPEPAHQSLKWPLCLCPLPLQAGHHKAAREILLWHGLDYIILLLSIFWWLLVTTQIKAKALTTASKTASSIPPATPLPFDHDTQAALNPPAVPDSTARTCLRASACPLCLERASSRELCGLLLRTVLPTSRSLLTVTCPEGSSSITFYKIARPITYLLPCFCFIAIHYPK